MLIIRSRALNVIVLHKGQVIIYWLCSKHEWTTYKGVIQDVCILMTPYMNVIKYFETLLPNFLEQQDDAYLLNHVLPWLGLTDWSSTSGSKGGTHGGRTRQMANFKSKLRKYLIQRDQRIGLKRSASSALAPASVLPAPASVLPASVLPASALPLPLSQQELRAARAAYFDFSLSKGDKGGKRATTKKPRRVRKCKTVKKAKRRCKK